MAGLPLGAARQHDVPAELLAYERIVRIEYIETSAGIAYPRSAAYRPTDAGGEMLVRDKAPDIDEIELDEPAARDYIDGLVRSGLFRWNRVYRPAQGTFMLDGVNWRIEVTFSKAGLKSPRPFRVEGENVFPDNYEEVVALLMRLPENGQDGQDEQDEQGEA